jgi:hypothetical protein
MKNILIFLIVFSLSIDICSSQPKNPIASNKIKQEVFDSLRILKNQINILEKKINISDSVLERNIKILIHSVDLTRDSLDNSMLRESLKTSENTINNQRSFIQIFEVVFGMLAFLSGFLYFFSIRPLTNQANTALERSNAASDRLEKEITEFERRVDSKINARFDLYKEELKKKEINEIFIDIESNLPTQRRLQIERLTRCNFALDSEKIDRLFKVLDSSALTEFEKSTLLEYLMQIDSSHIQKHFEIWRNVKKDEFTIINLLYNYYINKGIDSYVVPISSIINNRIDPHTEFNRLLDMLPSHPNLIIVLVNSKILINSLNSQSRQGVISHLEEGLKTWNLLETDKIKNSYLYKI